MTSPAFYLFRNAGRAFGTHGATLKGMVRRMWTELREGPTGRRFRRFHRDHARHRRGWARLAVCVAAGVCFVIGFILMFIPGPAVVFYALTGALLATQSRWMARFLDHSELKARAVWRRYRRHKQQNLTPGSAAASGNVHH